MGRLPRILSLSGCGFNVTYHTGIAKWMQEHGALAVGGGVDKVSRYYQPSARARLPPSLSSQLPCFEAVYGTSLGALIASCLVCDVDINTGWNYHLKWREEGHNSIFKCYGLIADHIREVVKLFFDDDAYARANGRLFISCSEWLPRDDTGSTANASKDGGGGGPAIKTDGSVSDSVVASLLPGVLDFRGLTSFVSSIDRRYIRNEIISSFSSNADLVDAMLASQFLPLWTSGRAGGYEFRGKYYFDGGLTENCPRVDPSSTLCVYATKDLYASSEPAAESEGMKKMKDIEKGLTIKADNPLYRVFHPYSTEGDAVVQRKGYNDMMAFMKARAEEGSGGATVADNAQSS
eukprot:CAMPEP_0113896784 /NCGR_PEP_ID=MMETSP0780_2-20120614/18252_1 /TAXON_ID=652834 /ORGANISM="Palpitomonas bilix" /LENGTH=348 /DNA_ID=CAMNT_0000888047 /DNA_START=329 /DNA_END=1375 /DNA_ORIENTATION=- /assembly_acc=CAM_ASM_000599